MTRRSATAAPVVTPSLLAAGLAVLAPVVPVPASITWVVVLVLLAVALSVALRRAGGRRAGREHRRDL